MHWSVTAPAALVSSIFLSPLYVPAVSADAPPEPPGIAAEDDAVLSLPPGHPPIDELPVLPPGHPPLEELMQLPPGHPPIYGCPGRPSVEPALEDEDDVVPIPPAHAHARSPGVDI